MVSEPAINMAGDVSPHGGKVEMSVAHTLATDSSKYCGWSYVSHIPSVADPPRLIYRQPARGLCLGSNWIKPVIPGDAQI